MVHTVMWRETIEGETVAGTATAIGYEQPVKTSISAEDELGRDCYVWSAVEVKVCVTKGEGGGRRAVGVPSFRHHRHVQGIGLTPP